MKFFEKVTPESCGVSSKNIVGFIEAMCKGMDDQETHSFMLVRHGKILAEGYFAPYEKDVEHTLFSVSKSFASIAIGFLVEEGKIKTDDYIYTYFPELITEDINKENLKIKVHDLLCMSFGQKGGAVHEAQKRNDLSDAMLYDFFYREKQLECGEKFRYDAFGTYMLAALVRKITGENVVEYLMPRLFEPLEIEKPYYPTDSIGNAIGYSGMRMRMRDLAKVGIVYLNGGKFGDKQIVPENWVKLATQKHIGTEHVSTGLDWKEGYCYQFWKGRYNTTRLCGAHGQMCVLMPDYDAIFVINSGYDNDKLSYILESFYENIMFNMKDEPLPEDKENFDKMEDIINNLRLTYKFSEMSPLAKIVSGNTYDVEETNIYRAVKLDFDEDEVHVTLVSDIKNYEFTAGFSKPVFGEPQETRLASLERTDNFKTVATAAWLSRKELEITLRLIGCPTIIKIVADFSLEENPVKIVPVRSRKN